MKARFWTNKECKTTLGQCKKAGFEIIATDGFTRIFNNGDLVVSWLKGVNNTNLVRVDLSYFG